MQFHHHGYVSQDPRVLPAAGTGIDRPAAVPDEVDVLIVGSGPAGMLLAAQLSQYPDVVTRLIERRDGRIFLWLVSDNNFNNWQRSLLTEFELVGLPLHRATDSKKAAR